MKNKIKVITKADYNKNQDSYMNSFWLQTITLILAAVEATLFGIYFLNDVSIAYIIIGSIILLMEAIFLITARVIDIKNDYAFAHEQYGKDYENIYEYVKVNSWEVALKPLAVIVIKLTIAVYLGWYIIILFKDYNYHIEDIIVMALFLFSGINFAFHFKNILAWLIDLI